MHQVAFEAETVQCVSVRVGINFATETVELQVWFCQ